MTKSSIVFDLDDKNKKGFKESDNKKFIPKYHEDTPFGRKIKEFYNNASSSKTNYEPGVNVTTGTLKKELKE